MSELSQQEINEQMYLFAKRWIDDLPFEESKKTPVMAIAYCLARLSKQDELLKEQEPVAPVLVGRMWECGKCHAPVGIFMDDKRDQFCRTCGRSVKWE